MQDIVVGNSLFQNVTQTPTLNVQGSKRVDFEKNSFDVLIQEKGRDILFEKALQCPCKSIATNQQSDCLNCGGTSWFYVNPIRTKMIIQSMSLSTNFKNWSQEDSGAVNVTAMHREHLSFMDRLTLLDGESIHTEVLHFQANSLQTEFFAYTTYNIRQALYVGLYQSSTQQLVRLTENVDFTIINNKISLNVLHSTIKQYIGEYSWDQDRPSVTIRYKHCPTYHIVEMKRETMQSYVFNLGLEKVIDLPISATAKRVHYISTEKPITEKLLNNNFIEEGCQNSDEIHITIPPGNIPPGGIGIPNITIDGGIIF